MLKLRVTFNPFVQKAEPPPVAKKDEPETLCGCFLLVGGGAVGGGGWTESSWFSLKEESVAG